MNLTVELANLQMPQEMKYLGNTAKAAGTVSKQEAKKITQLWSWKD